MSLVIALAVGALLGNAFLHLIPEAFQSSFPTNTIALFVMGGIFLFFVLDKFLNWHHANHKIQPMGYKVLIADGVHNLIDGIVIGAAFLISPGLGLTTTVAVLLHEIPQEIADFGILLYAGFTRTRAVMLNFASALLAIIGVITALTIGARVETFTPAMLAMTAGMFIYLAGTDLIPELHHETSLGQSIKQIIIVAIGIGLMILLR